MRIIHTADWHLCTWLGRVNRTDDLKRRVERVAELCQEHNADVLLIAGDLFYERAGLKETKDALDHVRDVFQPFFSRGGTVLAITGNHDRDDKIDIVRAGMTLAAPAAGKGGPLSGGRMYLANGRAMATLEAGGTRVQFVLVPYPFKSRYDLSDAVYHSKEEETRLLQSKIAEYIQSVSRCPDFDSRLPTVLAAHLHVRGAEVHTLYQMTERDDVVFDPGFLPAAWAYVALGHIHKPQALNGQLHVRYPGSLDRLDFGETHEDHGVLLMDIGATGLVGEPQRLPIPATRFHNITLIDPETELPRLADRYPDRYEAIVKMTVEPTATGPSRDEIARQVRKLFPRLFELKWIDPERSADDERPSWENSSAGFETKVRDYLNHRLAGDPNKDELLNLAESFLTAGDQQ